MTATLNNFAAAVARVRPQVERMLGLAGGDADTVHKHLTAGRDRLQDNGRLDDDARDAYRAMFTALAEIEDPLLLGDPPVRDDDGTCSYCGDDFAEHWSEREARYVAARKFHRYDKGDVPGVYSDEIPGGAR
ncbi:hypothetical protein [Kibdelosporangium phytohabitans]|uniref:Uncharacterized protein n=1 Tax=Kibdelosporangium phytohabitans TaxID=860235 RepID=A0A0N9HM48_9PSEU|nr:hypothetical protein [Kibdelosporangium phytohabitans]ALG07640.1 hypothetical protein AOZ06_12635 [Kibdelosporangium phytohabitans]ALG07696.1 hypothetical protein AOZ06_12955 [Kibdelosporangium phytohabitans]MBE1471406.1 hypothetical protein [Kibdelosporangium phytohabitans]